MRNYIVKEESLTAIADSIRAKTGGTDELVFPDGFVEAVEGISGSDTKNVSLEVRQYWGSGYCTETVVAFSAYESDGLLHSYGDPAGIIDVTPLAVAANSLIVLSLAPLVTDVILNLIQVIVSADGGSKLLYMDENTRTAVVFVGTAHTSILLNYEEDE